MEIKHCKVEPNGIIKDVENNIAYIVLYDKQRFEIARAIIDLEDVGKVRNYKWNYRRKKYVAYSPFKEKIDKKLTNVILNISRKPIYHKNGNPLDCRKENLRLALDNNTKSKKDNVLRILMKNAKLKGTTIAEKLGLSTKTVDHWINGSNIPLKYIDKVSNILGVKSEVLTNNFDVSKIKDILNKIDKFKEENPELPISISRNYKYIFPVEIENFISQNEEQYFKENIKNYQMILDKLK